MLPMNTKISLSLSARKVKFSKIDTGKGPKLKQKTKSSSR